MQKVNSVNEIKVGHMILFLDSDSNPVVEKIRGMNTVVYVDYKSGFYRYKNHEGKHYEGNLFKFLKEYEAFIIDSSYNQYDDNGIRDAFLSFEWVFENLYGARVGSFLRKQTYEMVMKDFKKRIVFIDFVEKHEKAIHVVRWQVDEELGYDEYDVNVMSNHLKKAIEFELALFE